VSLFYTVEPTFTSPIAVWSQSPDQRSLGLRTSLSVKYAQGDLSIIDSYNMDSIKTKDAKGITDNHGWRSALIVHGYAACCLLQAIYAPNRQLKPFQVRTLDCEIALTQPSEHIPLLYSSDEPVEMLYAFRNLPKIQTIHVDGEPVCHIKALAVPDLLRSLLSLYLSFNLTPRSPLPIPHPPCFKISTFTTFSSMRRLY
jgi:hypothetical protein